MDVPATTADVSRRVWIWNPVDTIVLATLDSGLTRSPHRIAQVWICNVLIEAFSQVQERKITKALLVCGAENLFLHVGWEKRVHLELFATSTLWKVTMLFAHQRFFGSMHTKIEVVNCFWLCRKRRCLQEFWGTRIFIPFFRHKRMCNVG